LSQRCPHQGCLVPWCPSSQWFECPCHGSKFDRVGECRQGPATRGMYHYQVTIDAAGQVVVDTRRTYLGPPLGTDTTGQPPQGPHCV
jgi:cytochrome b6-f complex iron-sulfur subunit